ncbi:MAG: gliding motility protein GldM [Bacteroidetes bacterium]|nr:gliding motility protein GldM [Bacteroidota bacterium]MBT3750609.1 gliding motility protein GldM [Bacteroidota bacterium]MBT4409022.1 gliding motility protein GldM [Bacteroidota bacterium]MBT5428219.1 gliding motility protein GldM [Bacteroidota bacterium]MBT7463801.1 gliding motility protein GldM [Bacteroidota bacterium]
MAGRKETPRQKMISMMYLVLTTLLALNVSKEVLEAFVVVNEGVIRTNLSFSKKINDSYSNFEKSYQINQTKVLPYWIKAQTVQKISREMITYIGNMRDELIAVTERISIDSARVSSLMHLTRKDDNSVTTNFLIGSLEDGSNGKARELKNKIIEYREQLLNLIDPELRKELTLGLITDGDYYNADGQKQSWEIYHFFDTILAADVTILNKLITEVYIAEFDVINHLLNAIGAEDFQYDKIAAKVLPMSNYVFLGEQYNAEIIVAAYDTTQSPEVLLMPGVDSLKESLMDQAHLINSNGGQVKFSLPANREGIHRYAGLVRVRNAAGTPNDYHFSNNYTVVSPTLTVSATKMNVFYIGVDNTVSISVSGIPKENLRVSISCGSLHQDPVNQVWIAQVPSGYPETTVSVSGIIDGKIRRMGSERFRIKQIPDPVARIANKREGYIDKEIIIATGSIIPEMPSDFEFYYNFRIKSFQLSLQRGFKSYQFTAESGQLTQEMVSQIERTNRGQQIVFDQIIAIGPDNDERYLSPIILTIN